MSEFSKYIKLVAEGASLNEEDSTRAFQIIMNGGANPAEIAALLMAMEVRNPSPVEIAGAARAMRVKMQKIQSPPDAIDVCGTGGDGLNTLNVSTAVAIVVAACGVPVAKHGNRSVSSRSGSSDVMAILGVNLNISPQQAERSLAEAGICYLPAPVFHPAMRHVAQVRQDLGIKTIFNLLGPLCNPAGVKKQVIGVYSSKAASLLVNVLPLLEFQSVWLVHSADGMDELSPAAKSDVIAFRDNAVSEISINPEDYGFKWPDLQKLKGGDAEYNAREMRKLLAGAIGEYRDAVLLNAAAALMVAGKCHDMLEGVNMAAEAVDSGKSREKLEKLVEFSNLS
jgi:anthranilate phosphoribosyltransferase